MNQKKLFFIKFFVIFGLIFAGNSAFGLEFKVLDFDKKVEGVIDNYAKYVQKNEKISDILKKNIKVTVYEADANIAKNAIVYVVCHKKESIFLRDFIYFGNPLKPGDYGVKSLRLDNERRKGEFTSSNWGLSPLDVIINEAKKTLSQNQNQDDDNKQAVSLPAANNFFAEIAKRMLGNKESGSEKLRIVYFEIEPFTVSTLLTKFTNNEGIKPSVTGPLFGRLARDLQAHFSSDYPVAIAFSGGDYADVVYAATKDTLFPIIFMIDPYRREKRLAKYFNFGGIQYPVHSENCRYVCELFQSEDGFSSTKGKLYSARDVNRVSLDVHECDEQPDHRRGIMRSCAPYNTNSIDYAMKKLKGKKFFSYI
jgi:hypothetical protein